MGVIFRQSLQNSIISYLGIALGFIITIWLYPSILTPEQYGLTRVLLSLAMVSMQLANLGIKNTIIRFFPFFRDKENNHNGFLFIALVVPLLGILLIGVFLFVFRTNITQYFIERSELLVDYFWFILPLAFCILFFHVLTRYVQALYDTVMSSFLMDVGVRVLNVIMLVLYAFAWITFQQLMVIFVLNYGIILLFLLIYTFRTTNASFLPNFSFLNRPLVREMAGYSMFAFFGGVATIVVNNIDVIMLSSLAGLEDTGIYAIAFYIGSAITIIRNSIYKISSPIIADAFKDQNFSLIREIYRRSSLNQLIAGGLLFCGIITNLDNLMSLLPPAYAGGAMVIIVIGAANIFDMATGINGSIILNSKHYRFDLYSTLFLIVIAVILNYLLIPSYGILGAAIGTASSILVYNILKVFYVWIRFSMQPFQQKMWIILLVSVVTLVLVFQMPTIINTYTDILIRSILVTSIYVIPIWLLNVSQELNQLIEGFFRKIRIFTE